MKINEFKWKDSFESACGSLTEGLKTAKLSTARAKIDKKTKAHYHENSNELYIVLKGSGKVRVKERGEGINEYELKEGKEVLIPPFHIHQTDPDGELIVETVNMPPWEEEDEKLVDEDLFSASL